MSLSNGRYVGIVVKSLSPGEKLVRIPKRSSDPLSPPIKARSAIDANVDERVIIEDLSKSHIPDWYISDYESKIGRGSDSPGGAHTHPIGQVDGLVAALEAKVDDSQLTSYETASQVAAKYATQTSLTEGLATKASSTHSHNWDSITSKPLSFTPSAHTHTASQITDLGTTLEPYATDADVALNYVTKTSYNSGMDAKAAAPGAWQNVTLSTYMTIDPPTGPPLQIRYTPLGMQLRGRYRWTSSVPRDAVVFTLPQGFAPPAPIMFDVPSMAAATAYTAIKYQFEMRVNGTVTAREALQQGAVCAFNTILTFD